MAAEASHPGPRRVVVLGAGFAGVKVAKGLEAACETTLIAPTDKFTFLPIVHEVLSEHLTPREATRGLDDLLERTRLVYGRGERVDGNELVTHDGERYPFDVLVVAIGAEPNDFGVPGVREHALTFYSIGDALMANATLKQRAAELDGSRPLRVNVVGASFTGVELAGEVAELLDKLDVAHEVTLLEARRTIFPEQSEPFRRGVHEGLDLKGIELATGRTITRVGPDSVHVEHAGTEEDRPSDVTFWAAGVRARTLLGIDPTVDEHLRSTARDDVFVVGDAASFPPDQPVPKLAQTAEDQASVVVRNIKRPDRLRAYGPRVRGLIVSIGHRYAVAETADGLVFKGRVPWHVKRNLYKAKIRLQ